MFIYKAGCQKKNLLITKIIRTFTAKITRSISFKKKL